MPRILYLHGFASGPDSRKGRFFREKLAPYDISLESPDLADGDFRNLTLTGQLQLIDRVAANEPVFLIGSSMGGYLAALYASAHHEVQGLILLAPAFNFYQRWTSTIAAADLAQWKRDGEVPVFHYAAGGQVPIGYQLIEDAQQYEPFPAFTQPCLDFHGVQDPVVPIEYSEQFAGDRPNVELIKLQSGHELTDVLDDIWDRAGQFVLQRIRE
jgi:pimeloyl-ACP methyl ester carboxylesterase